MIKKFVQLRLEQSESATAMTHRLLLLWFHFSEGQGCALDFKDGVVTKTRITSRRSGNYTGAATLNLQQDLACAISQTECSSELSSTIQAVAQFAQQPRNAF